MKYVVVALVALACIACAEETQNYDEMIIANVKTTRPVSGPVLKPIEPATLAAKDKPASNAVDIAKIAQVGKTVWDIIKDGRPVQSVSSDWAGAVPKGADWTELEGFVDARWGPFCWEYENLWGSTVAKFSWYFSWTCKGSYNRKGAYIMNAGVAIKEIYSAWTFNVDVTASVESNPVNYGTKANPIAGLAIQVQMKTSGLFQTYTDSCRVSLRGNCNAYYLSC